VIEAAPPGADAEGMSRRLAILIGIAVLLFVAMMAARSRDPDVYTGIWKSVTLLSS
jgi:hypothetical protein